MRTQKNFWNPCYVCGSTENIQMHQVKHIRKMNEKVKGFTKIMAMLNRKQIPVCHSYHVKIHNGTYDEIRLTELNKKR